MSQILIKSPVSGDYITSAKHYGTGPTQSPATNYYQTGGGSVIHGGGPYNPGDWQGLIYATGSGDTYQQMTLAFCWYPLELNSANDMEVFSSERGNIIVANWDSNGGIWFGCRSSLGTIKNLNTPNSTLSINNWHSVLMAFDGTDNTNRNCIVYVNGSEVYNGTWGSGGSSAECQNNPQSWNGYVWAGAGHFYSSTAANVPDRGMECYVSQIWCAETYLDPGTNWSKFYDGNNKPIDLGADGSGPTGSQPDTFAPNGDLTNNLGFGINWDEVGTVPDAPISPTD